MTPNKTARKGILLMNLGSPDSTRVPDVKRYLDEFLMDKRVIDYPYLFRWLLVRGIITPSRSPKSAEAYEKVWWPEGSPLIVLTERLKKALEPLAGMAVETAMRYGNPSTETGFTRLMERVEGLEEVLAFPLYPHYAMSSYETAAAHVRKVHEKANYPFKLTVMRPFYDDPGYISALAERISPFLERPYDYLLFSYHGVPERHIRKGDVTGHHCLQRADCCSVHSPAHQYCYRHQIITTMELTARALALPREKYGFSFQSRLGKDPWLKPYSVQVLEEMPSKGIKKLLVACPAFVADCLETLEEMAMQGREIFMKAGGESFELIPCLNDHPAWVNVLAGWVEAYEAGSTSMVSAM